MYRTLLAIALTSMVSLSYAADNAPTTLDAAVAETIAAPVASAAKKVKRSKVKLPIPPSKVKVATPKVAPSKIVIPTVTEVPKTPGFILASTEIAANGAIPQSFETDDFGCMGENRSPELHWTGAPADTQSFAVTVYDPDAPTGSGWWHWVVYDLPADTEQLDSGIGSLNSSTLPGNAMQALSDYGVAAWGGTCPPPGDKPHRYIFTVYALKVPQLDAPANATPAMVSYMIRANSIASATFTAHYGRAN